MVRGRTNHLPCGSLMGRGWMANATDDVPNAAPCWPKGRRHPIRNVKPSDANLLWTFPGAASSFRASVRGDCGSPAPSGAISPATARGICGASWTANPRYQSCSMATPSGHVLQPPFVGSPLSARHVGAPERAKGRSPSTGRTAGLLSYGPSTSCATIPRLCFSAWRSDRLAPPPTAAVIRSRFLRGLRHSQPASAKPRHRHRLHVARRARQNRKHWPPPCAWRADRSRRKPLR
mmetsp:Transcript_8354/g.21287  ORF Transcript_8354/g.21287 Transcript_8354/m.21287 type:complete len:234 (+) Transcript_8354:192-893(+)